MADKYNAKNRLLESNKRLQEWKQSSANIMGEANKEFKRALPKIAEQGRKDGSAYKGFRNKITGLDKITGMPQQNLIKVSKGFKTATKRIPYIGTAMSVVSIGKNLIKIAKNKMNMKPMPGSKGYKKK